MVSLSQGLYSQEEVKEVVKKKRTVRTPVPVQTESAGLSGKQLSVRLTSLLERHFVYHLLKACTQPEITVKMDLGRT